MGALKYQLTLSRERVPSYVTAKQVHLPTCSLPGELSFWIESGHSLTASRKRPSVWQTRSMPE
jgi:hypothetical protein